MVFYTTNEIFNLSDTEEQSLVYYNTSVWLKKNNKYNKYSNTEILVNSILYALFENKYENIESICNFIDMLCSSMFMDIESKFYGLFPYSCTHKEEDYINPDYDYQSNIISILLEIYLEFKDVLHSSTIKKIRNACIQNATTLIYAHNNIDAHNQLLEILCLICIGETFKIPAILDSGIHKLHSFTYLTLYNNSLMEYNHPEKIILSLESSNYFEKYIQNTDSLETIHVLRDVMLTCLYSHFNPKFMQWTGPMSIFYYDFLPEHFLKKIIAQSNSDVFKVPQQYYAISPISGNQFMQSLVSGGFLYPHFKSNMIASSYNTNTFSLGTFNHDDMWIRRKPCISYFGTPESPYCLQIRCLLDDFDFSSAAFHSIQYKGAMLGHINFSTNRGYKNLSIDHKKTYKMNDLRVRFQIVGDISKLKHSKHDNTINIIYENLSITFNVHYAVFEDYKIQYQFSTLSNLLYMDIILYSGETIELTLEEINKAVIAFSLFMGTNKKYKIPEVHTWEDDKFLYSECTSRDNNLKLKSHKKPDFIEIIFTHDCQFLNDTRLDVYVDKLNAISTQHKFIFSNNEILPTISREETPENKRFIKKLNNLDKHPLEDIIPEVDKLVKEMKNISISTAKHYSVYTIMKLFEIAKQTDARFIKIIETNYSQTRNKISYANQYSQLKKTIISTAERLILDYKKLLASTKKTDNIKLIIDVIHAEYINPDLSLQEISNRMGVSEAYLSREFHNIIGVSYINYITKIRIEKAISLINEDVKISDIPKKCGYYSLQTFNAAFKRYTGVTAKKYMNNIASTDY